MAMIDIEAAYMDQPHARLVGVLLSCAQNLQTFKKCVDLCDAEAGATVSVELLFCLHKLYGYDATALERDTLALAKLLGFDVELIHIAAHAVGVSN